MEQQYYDTKQICKILGCSRGHALEILSHLPAFRLTQNRRSPYRVKIEDFNRFMEEHTIQPNTPRPRTSPYETASQKVERETENWHKRRKENA
jgi:hypothetical protein